MTRCRSGRVICRIQYRERRPADRGSAVIEALLLGILLLVPLLYFVSYAASAQRAAFAVHAAARAGGRAFVTSPTRSEAHDRARSAAIRVIHEHGIDPSRSDVRVYGELVRDGLVRVEVYIPVASAGIPLLSEIAPVTVATAHIEQVDRHRGIR